MSHFAKMFQYFIILVILSGLTGIVSAAIASGDDASDPPVFVKGTVLSKSYKGELIQHFYLVLDVSYRSNVYEDHSGDWYYKYQRLYQYPTKGGWYLVSSDEPEEGDQYIFGLGYEDPHHATGEILNVDTVPVEPNYIEPTPRFESGDIVKVKEDDGSWKTYLISGYDNSKRYDIYHTQIIVPKEDGSWGYMDSTEISFIEPHKSRDWIDASPNSLVTHLNLNTFKGLEYVNPPLPTYTPKPSITTLVPIQIDRPIGPSTLPPTPIRTEGPSSNPFYPFSTPTPLPVVTLPYGVQTVAPVSIEPVLVSPVAISPTAQPTFRFGKRYAVGDPGSFLGTKYGGGTTTTVTKRTRTVTGSDAVLKPGSRAYGITPPASGSFVRWYPAARWAAGIK